MEKASIQTKIVTFLATIIMITTAHSPLLAGHFGESFGGALTGVMASQLITHGMSNESSANISHLQQSIQNNQSNIQLNHANIQNLASRMLEMKNVILDLETEIRRLSDQIEELKKLLHQPITTRP